MNSKNNPRSPFHLVYSIFLLFGLFSLFTGLERIYAGHQTKQWQTVTGKIKSSKIYDQGVGKKRIRKPIIKYIYLVNGTQYQGGSVYLGDENSRSNLFYTNQMVDKYSANQQALVYYNPAAPQNSVLETGIAEIPWPSYIFGIGFTVAGSGFLWLSKNGK